MTHKHHDNARGDAKREHDHDHDGGHAHDHDHDHHHDHPHRHDEARVTAPSGADVCAADAPCVHGDMAVHHVDRDAICVQNLSFRYPSTTVRDNDDTARPGNGDALRKGNGSAGAGRLVLRDINLHVEYGCNLGIIGPNGAGKTTLLQIMLGLLEGYTGKVAVCGLPPKKACRRGDLVGYVPQRAHVEWRFPVTALQVVRMGLTGKTGFVRWFSRDDRDYAEHIMARVGVAHLRDEAIGALSGGQQQRLFIARALVAKPKVLILDEPLVGVDEAGQKQFAGLIHELHESLGLTIVVVSHDLQTIAAGCNRVACLRQTIHYHAAPQGLTQEVLREVFEHDIAPVFGRP